MSILEREITVKASEYACVLEHISIWQRTNEHLAEWTPDSDGLCRTILAGANTYHPDFSTSVSAFEKLTESLSHRIGHLT